jgi:hypothetical protein
MSDLSFSFALSTTAWAGRTTPGGTAADRAAAGAGTGPTRSAWRSALETEDRRGPPADAGTDRGRGRGRGDEDGTVLRMALRLSVERTLSDLLGADAPPAAPAAAGVPSPAADGDGGPVSSLLQGFVQTLQAALQTTATAPRSVTLQLRLRYGEEAPRLGAMVRALGEAPAGPAGPELAPLMQDLSTVFERLTGAWRARDDAAPSLPSFLARLAQRLDAGGAGAAGLGSARLLDLRA